MTNVKEQLHKLAETLPENATWSQAMYELYVRQQIADGEEAVVEGCIDPHEEVKKRFSRT